MYGGLALMLCGVLQQQINNPMRRLGSASKFLFAGSIIFPSSLYLLCLTKKGFFGAITPIGGVCYVVAFAIIAYDAFTSQ